MYDVECPYCGENQEIDHDDGYGYEEGEDYSQQCGSCLKTFAFTTEISFDYRARKADCLNDGKHEYEPTVTFPKECTKMRCKMCGEERNPTNVELQEILKGVQP